MKTIDDIIGIFTLALIVTAIGIAVRPGSQAPQLIDSVLKDFAGIQRASYGA